MARPALHLIGFRGDEYWSVKRIWPDMPVMIHRVHDLRAQRDIGLGDIVVFANREREAVIRDFNGNDIDEADPAKGE